MEPHNRTGILYIVATPMGNLEDMTFRAVRILKEADLIAAEDTRYSKRLLTHYGIETHMISCHEHNEAQKSVHLIAALTSGKTVALISDAGTPLISDPGYCLVKAAARQNISIIPVPGCNAAIAGLSVAGLPTDSFRFCGFLPKKQQKLGLTLKALEPENATLIFYESPKRICRLIQQVILLLGDRNACLAREMTKLHEEYLRGTLGEILSALEVRPQVKGECVLFVQGSGPPPQMTQARLEELILSSQSENRSTADLAREIAAASHLPKKQVYDTLLRLRNTSS
jgi:16S rRNA (cytidine1402-2'-O)-methyltransferase